MDTGSRPCAGLVDKFDGNLKCLVAYSHLKVLTGVLGAESYIRNCRKQIIVAGRVLIIAGTIDRIFRIVGIRKDHIAMSIVPIQHPCYLVTGHDISCGVQTGELKKERDAALQLNGIVRIVLEA